MRPARGCLYGFVALALALGLVWGAPPSANADEGADAKPAKPAKTSQPSAAEAPAGEAASPKEEADAGPPFEFPEAGIITKADGTVLYFYRTNFVTPKDLQASLTTLLKVPEVTFQPFDQQNVLLFSGEPEAVELALEAASYFDVSVPQVFIEAKVIEITYDSNFEFGLDYLWSRDQIGPNTLFRGAESILNPTSFIGSTLPGGLPFQGTSVLFGFVGKKAEDFGLLDVTLQALQQDGKAEILSKPSIICTQGKEAQVQTSEDRQIIQFQNADQNNTRYQSSTLTTGVTLKVTATHVGENFVTLEINPQVKGVQGVSAVGIATLRPILTTRSANTTVTMADGETLVIGGLYTNASVRSKAKTPLISDIPLLGELFTRTQETKAKTELIFMLTPTIVRRTAELKVVMPPAELDRLEGERNGECWRPAGPSLVCPPECRKKPGPVEPGATPPLPPPVTSSPSSQPRTSVAPLAPSPAASAVRPVPPPTPPAAVRRAVPPPPPPPTAPPTPQR